MHTCPYSVDTLINEQLRRSVNGESVVILQVVKLVVLVWRFIHIRFCLGIYSSPVFSCSGVPVLLCQNDCFGVEYKLLSMPVDGLCGYSSIHAHWTHASICGVVKTS